MYSRKEIIFHLFLVTVLAVSGRIAAQVVKITGSVFFAQLNLKSFDSKNKRIDTTSAKMPI
jgi:hypothetical protein